MITEVEDFFAKGCGRCARFDTPACSARKWADGLVQLRMLCQGAGLEEKVKWGHPCYIHAGRNIAIIGAFVDDFRLTFFDAALLDDTEGLLELAGPNSPTPSVMRFRDVAQVATRSTAITAYLTQAIGFAKAGVKPPKVERDQALPDVLIAALDADPELAEAFFALTPGRQRSYVIALSSAKKVETQIARIAKFRAPILKGKGAMER